jgi:hypothetical protein
MDLDPLPKTLEYQCNKIKHHCQFVIFPTELQMDLQKKKIEFERIE